MQRYRFCKRGTIATRDCCRDESFLRDEDGAILPFTLLMFLIMVVATGMAVDYMRHETLRAELQNGLDRGLLAAG